MFRSAFTFIALLFSFTNIFPQNSLDNLMYSYGTKFWSVKEYIYVQGRLCDSFPGELNNYFTEWKKPSSFKVKYEDQLDSTDLTKHLNFFGPVKSYKYLSRFLPSAVTITPKGFSLGKYEFTDSLDAISLITSEGNRRFQLGNSLSGVLTIWSTFADISQYIIMQKYAITHHGFLNNNSFDQTRHYDVASLRKQQLKNYESAYYSFHYDPAIFTSKQNMDSLFHNEDIKLVDVINRLKFPFPDRKIECYLYKDLEQKYYLSATPGFGNPFPEAYQNHSVGFGPAEHESIHILTGRCSTLFAEGLVGYYYSTKDSMEWKKNNRLVSQHPDFAMKDFMLNSNNFDFSPLSYAASAHLAVYLINTYGLDKYKQMGRFDDNKRGSEEIYHQPLDSIVYGWNRFFLRNKYVLGPEREIKIKVIPINIPDTSSICIAGDISQLGAWDPSKVKLIKQNDGGWTKTFHFAEGTILLYKITRGSWDNEALDDNGNVPPNSTLDVKVDETIIIKINKWKDQILN